MKLKTQKNNNNNNNFIINFQNSPYNKTKINYHQF